MAKAKKKTTTAYNPISYIQAKNPGTYVSPYATQLTTARNQLMNYKYDPLQDASYQALSRLYEARGNQAAQDTLGDAAALNGGFGTSYAVSAAQQARNQYNQELAALIPDFEANAYNRLAQNYNLLMDADQTAYGRFRDAMADYQWGKGYDTDIYQYNQSLKKSSGGGGGGRRRSSGGGYSSALGNTGSSDSYLADLYTKAQEELNKDKKKKAQSGAGGGYAITNKNVLKTK